MPFYTYIIQNQLNHQFYIGQTQDLHQRLLRHNSNRSNYTKNKGEWKLVFYFMHETRSQAMKLEKQLKQFKSRTKIIEYVQRNMDKINHISDIELNPIINHLTI